MASSDSSFDPSPRREHEPDFLSPIASARFFCREVLPNVAHARAQIERSAMDLMDVPVEAF